MPAGGDVDEGGGHRGGGRKRAGAASLQHHAADKITLGDDRVEDALDRGNGGGARYHARVHALLEPVIGHPGDAEQLDAEAELLSEIDVEPRDMADALGVDAGEADRPAEGDAGQDRQLVRGVDPVDIETRLGFRGTAHLRLGKQLGLAVEQLHDTGADRAEPGYGDLQSWFHRAGPAVVIGNSWISIRSPAPAAPAAGVAWA